MQTKLLINGTLTAGQGTVERVLDPATGDCIADKIYDRLVADLSAAVRTLKVGSQSENGVDTYG